MNSRHRGGLWAVRQLQAPGLLLCHVLQNPVKALQPLSGYLPLGRRFRQGAARITHVPAVTELAQADQRPDLPEAVLQLLWRHMPQAELADTRRVNQITTARQVKQLGGGRGVYTLAGTL